MPSTAGRSSFVDHLIDLREVRVEETNFAIESRQTFLGELKISWINIEPDEQARFAESFSDGPRMPAAAERAIDDGLARRQSECTENLVHQDWIMTCSGGGHLPVSIAEELCDYVRYVGGSFSGAAGTEIRYRKAGSPTPAA